MRRRNFLTLLGIVTLSSVSKAFGHSRSSTSRCHVCEIEISLPEKAKITDFQKSRKNWMKISSFDKILKEFKDKGLLLKIEREAADSKVRISYHFKDAKSHDEFVKIIDATETVSDATLRQAGYQFKRSHFLA